MMSKTECPDGTSPVEMEKGVNNRKDDKNEENDGEKGVECQITLPLLILRKV